MSITIQEVIKKINDIDDPNSRNQKLPDDALINKYEQETGFFFNEDYRIFLKTVSNAFVGYMSPFTLNDKLEEMDGELQLGIKDGRKAGVPQNWLPICEDNGDYYCIIPDGSICFWSHDGVSNEFWPNLATWAQEVWLDGG